MQECKLKTTLLTNKHDRQAEYNRTRPLKNSGKSE